MLVRDILALRHLEGGDEHGADVPGSRGTWVSRGTTAATKSARLTPDGRAARALFPALHADLEKQWRARFGGDSVRGLHSSLERMLGQREVLANGLEPYPDGWREQAVRRAHPAVLDDLTARLPHSPMVLHRGGWPDGF